MSGIAPHRARLLSRLRGLSAPAVQLWGWPGVGKTAVLEALIASGEGRGVSVADGSSVEGMRAAIEATREARAEWLVLATVPPPRVLSEVGRRLPPGLRVVFSDVRRRSLAPIGAAVIPPSELLLEAGEVVELWREVTGVEIAEATAERLRTAADGWLRPLILAAEAWKGDLPAKLPLTLGELEPVRWFLGAEVVPLLGDAAEGASAIFADPEGRVRVPLILASFLARRGSPQPPPGGAPSIDRPSFEVSLLGKPGVVRCVEGVETLLRFRLQRAFKVLAYLAMAPERSADREELAEAVWPGEGESEVERNFHPTLSHLRRSLIEGLGEATPPPLLLREGIYELNPAFEWKIDLAEFFRLSGEGRALLAKEPQGAVEAWRSAWAFYRGPLLPRFDEDWVALRREGALRRYTEMLRDLGETELALGRREAAMDAFRSLLFEDPLDEHIHLEVMRLYAAEGRRDLVRRQYDRLVRLLLDELGLEPEAETQRAFHQLMRI